AFCLSAVSSVRLASRAASAFLRSSSSRAAYSWDCRRWYATQASLAWFCWFIMSCCAEAFAAAMPTETPRPMIDIGSHIILALAGYHIARTHRAALFQLISGVLPIGLCHRAGQPDRQRREHRLHRRQIGLRQLRVGDAGGSGVSGNRRILGLIELVVGLLLL